MEIKPRFGIYSKIIDLNVKTDWDIDSWCDNYNFDKLHLITLNLKMLFWQLLSKSLFINVD